VNLVDQILASYLWTLWLVLVEVTVVRTSIAGLISGHWWWIHPATISRVDRTEPAATRNEIRFRRRRLEFLIAVALGWVPALAFQGALRPADPRDTRAILALTGVAVAVYLFRSLRRFDREGRERYVNRTIAEGQERLDSMP
jgi:hypothetical protein